VLQRRILAVHALSPEKNSRPHATRAKEIDPLFSSPLFENCPVLKILPALSGVKFGSSYLFYPMRAIIFYAAFFRVLESKGWG